MGRPRTPNTAMVNGRITAAQMAWLQERADGLGGNLSAALRQTVSDARLLEMARRSYWEMHDQLGFGIPNLPSGETPSLAWILEMELTEGEDLELRKEEGRP